jgi:hypothetical protein
MKSKNQEWKESGTDMSFKDWLRTDLNNTVQETVSFIGTNGTDSTTVNPNQNYVPTLQHETILGVNKYLFYTVVGLAVIGIGYGIAKKMRS